ncbi:MAG: slipin family protein, partial [Chloroflexota bacterium]|nr:slipin family protein [Chloroflexota bacterium]
VIHAEGEFQAAQRLADAGRIIAASPGTLQLRYLQTLTEITSERTNTLIFPIPIDLLQALAGRPAALQPANPGPQGESG